MSGTYREIVRPERIVHTELFDVDWTGGETTVTTQFTEAAGRTTLTITILHATREARDGALQSGMDSGLEAGYALLDALIEGAI